ncbi:hypothetical protein [Embleya hyalina]|uniref:Precorrin-3B synthase n=1 Tax=Embleya hyalina TaxID=516124 RepID=A0A401YXS2_9ACTN|nr:hypothetical protein [Embleya hyalina]GCD99391.1 precorrin-3B synthase [Embleya hyalina]
MPIRDRDDACPGVVDTSPADDGLIARVRLPGGRLGPRQVRELAALARRFGTGSVDLTARANIQLRGLAEADLPAFADAVAAAGLMPSRSHERVRNILASPLAGRDPRALLDADPILAAVDEAVCAAPDLTALSGRFLIGVDDGGLPIASARHDLDLVARSAHTVALYAAGHDTGWRFAPADAATAIVRAARAFLTARADSGAWHVRELPLGAVAFATALGADPGRPGQPDPAPDDAATHPDSRRRDAGPPIGVLRQGDGRYAVGVSVPLGRLTPEHMHALVATGAEVRITGSRGLVVRDLSDPAGVSAGLAAAGLSADPASPWRGVSACSGLGACRRALADVRAEATRHALGRSRAAALVLDENPDATLDGDPHGDAGPASPGRVATHWVGCARACGTPAGATVLVAREDGGYLALRPGAAGPPGAEGATAPTGPPSRT